jgi:hypothetical protein
MVNMNNILNIQMDETLFLNDICECLCLIYINYIIYVKLNHDNCENFIKI